MNKYKLLIIICFFLFTICLPKVTAVVKNINLLKKTIVLDADHQGIGVSQIWRMAIKPSKYKDNLFKNRLSFYKNLYFNVII